LAVPKPYDAVGSTAGVDFDTVKPTWPTRADKCHLSHVVADTGTWEQKLAQTLEDMPQVLSYMKNDVHVGFVIPYTFVGEPRRYLPDFIACLDDGHGRTDPLNLIIEVTGDKDAAKKQAKIETASTLWVPAVNNSGAWGRWAFVQVLDPWNAKKEIEKILHES
jgi:type III restriction enzyme